MTNTTHTTPAIDAKTWKERAARDLMSTLPVGAALLVRGEGCYVEDADGNRYLDFLAGIAVNALGHAHPAIVAAASEQAATLIHVSNFFSTPTQLLLAERLKRLTGAGEGGRVYFGNSGAEANEAAFKLARLNRGPDGTKTRILALKNAFHGRTMGALALTGKPALHAGFEPLPAGVEHIDATIEALEAAMGDDVAALILETVQGEAGILPIPEGFLVAARALTEKHGALLIVDEIQTGIGRTGAWFSYQHENVVPDAVTIAKGLGGGIPIGAIVTFGWASELFVIGQHGSTFGGNPFATGVANAVLTEIEDADLVGNAARRGVQLREGILALGSPLVAGVRGRGLLLGVALSAPVAKAVNEEALRHGLIINAPNASTIRLAPPLIVGDAEIADFLERFASVLAAVESATAVTA